MPKRKKNKPTFLYQGRFTGMMEQLTGSARWDTRTLPRATAIYFLTQFPALANRVPLAQLASYLGMTPQSLSRIRR